MSHVIELAIVGTVTFLAGLNGYVTAQYIPKFLVDLISMGGILPGITIASVGLGAFLSEGLAALLAESTYTGRAKSIFTRMWETSVAAIIFAVVGALVMKLFFAGQTSATLATALFGAIGAVMSGEKFGYQDGGLISKVQTWLKNLFGISGSAADD